MKINCFNLTFVNVTILNFNKRKEKKELVRTGSRLKVPDPTFPVCRAEGLQFYQKETPKQVFSCKYCEVFKNTSFYRISLVAASVT